MATECGGGNLVTPASMALMRDGLRRVLRETGLLVQADLPTPAPTRLMQVGGHTHHVYAMERGLFEPLVEIGDEVRAGQAAARIHFHDSPWREPLTVRFEIDALVLCKRAPAPCERGDCLYQLGTDLD
jgi:predicted deacylase